MSSIILKKGEIETLFIVFVDTLGFKIKVSTGKVQSNGINLNI